MFGKFLVALSAFIITLAFVALATVWGGFVLHVLWGWFIVPIGVPQISIAQSLGLTLIIRLLVAPTKTDKEDAPSNDLALMGVSPLIALIVGWVYHLFI